MYIGTTLIKPTFYRLSPLPQPNEAKKWRYGTKRDICTTKIKKLLGAQEIHHRLPVRK